MTPRPQLLAASVLLLAVLAVPAQGQFLEAAIPLGEEPYYLLWNPDGDKVYCSSGVANTVSIIDCGTNQIIATLDVPSGPSFFARNPHLNKVYCSSGDANRISVIDGVGDTLLRSIGASAWPGPMAYCEALDKLYVSCFDNQRVRVFDGATDELIDWVLVPGGPGNLVWNPVSNRVFCHSDFDSMYVIDCVTDSIIARHEVGGMGGVLSRHPASGAVYAPGHYTMQVFDSAGDSTVAEFGTGTYAPTAMCIVPYHDKLYLGDFNGSGIAIVDCSSNTIVDTLGAGWPFYCDTTRGGKVYCLHDGMDVYDGHADTVLTHLSFGRDLVEVVASPTQGRVYVADWMNDVVYVIRDTTTGIAEGPAPQARAASMLASPNPFSASVEFSGGSESEPPAEVCVYSRTGERVAVLHPARAGASRWRCVWDGRDALGRAVPAGVYFIRSLGLVTCCVVKTTSTR